MEAEGRLPRRGSGCFARCNGALVGGMARFTEELCETSRRLVAHSIELRHAAEVAQKRGFAYAATAQALRTHGEACRTGGGGRSAGAAPPFSFPRPDCWHTQWSIRSLRTSYSYACPDCCGA